MDDEERQAWTESLKRQYGIRCIGDEEEQGRLPEWPVVPEGATYTCVGEYAIASHDGVNFYVKPDGMPVIEWWASLPTRP